VVFRFNYPDGLLTLLLLLAVWAGWRAIETGRTDMLVLMGVCLGMAFLTKMLDALLVVPALGLTYLYAGPSHLARRLRQLGWAALAFLTSCGWWVAAVELWPKGARPHVGGSTDNSELNLIFGYNGLTHITGAGPSVPVDGGQGLLRMFNPELGGQISWLLPLAIAGALGGFALTRGRARTDRERAGFVLWGTLLLTFFAVYSSASGIFHAYYTVVMAPPVAALCGAGAVALWRLGRRSLSWAWVLPAAIVICALWADTLLGRTGGYDRWLGPTLVACGIVAALLLLVALVESPRRRWLGFAAGIVAAATLVGGPFAYSVTTVGNVTRAPATAGPQSNSMANVRTNARVPEGLIRYLEHHRGHATYLVAVTGTLTAAEIIVQTGQPVIAMGGYRGLDPVPMPAAFERLVASGKLRYLYTEGNTNSGVVSSDVSWAREHGTVVAPSSDGTAGTSWKLYDLFHSTAP
jgi:4-amino-4-deoxy-L-arabinose transferase-like glycosyltransferase